MSSLQLDEELDSISALYDHHRVSFTEITLEIVSIFKELLESKSEEFKLTYNNSAYPGYYFSFSSRVKTVKSFKEKLVRSNDVLKFMDLTLDEDKEKLLKSLDDLIGIKILGELEEDVTSICSLISSNLNWLSSKGIQIDTDMDSLPVQMKNGIDIFKMSCSFKKDDQTFLFELQVKSKLLSAWGDMEHSIFYKDYSGSAIKSSIQKVMNDVGRNLLSLDALLYSIRSSNKDYLKQRESILFLEHVQKLFMTPIKKYMNTTQNFDLNKIVGLLYRFDSIDKKKETFEFPESVLTHVESKDLGPNEKSLNIFINLKRTSISIRILEYIYTSYFVNSESYSEKVTDDQNYLELQKNVLNRFLDEYKKIVINEKSNFENVDAMYNNDKINELFDFIFINGNNDEILFLSNKYIYIFAFFMYISTEYADFAEDNNLGPQFKADGMEMLNDTSEGSEFYYTLVKMFALYVFSEGSKDIKPFLTKEECDELNENHDNIKNISKKILSEKIDDKKHDLNSIEYKKLITKFVNSNFPIGSEEQ